LEPDFMTVSSILHGADRRLASHLDLPQPYDLPAGSRIITQGQTSDYLFSVRSGMVRVTRSDAKNADRTIGFLFPGDFVGACCNMLNTCRYTAETVLPTTVCRWPRHFLEALVAEVPAARKAFLGEMSHEMTLIQQRMEILDMRTAAARIAAFLAMMNERWANRQDRQIMGNYPFPKAEIADFLNISPESFRNALKELKGNGVVRCPGPDQIAIENEGLLQSLILDAA
jgi:CRP/FNR family transcriptional regulator